MNRRQEESKGLAAILCRSAVERVLSLTLLAAAFALAGCGKDGGDGFTAVIGVTGVPTEAVTGTPLTLTGTVVPDGATNRTIVWSVKDAGETGAEIDGDTFTASAGGEAVVTATVANGKGPSTPYTQDFTIAVVIPYITMTTAKEGEVQFTLQGTGAATIDWGDDSEPETSALTSEETNFRHTYSGTNRRTITIRGGNITYLDCWNNQLTALDVSNNTKLTALHCYENQLSVLDVSKNTKLTYLDCWNNQLTALDAGKNTELTNLYCGSNQLTALDVSNNTELTQLYCYDNQLTAAGLNALFGTLHGNTVAGGVKNVYVGNNPGTAGCDAAIATAKGWTVER